MAEPNAGWTPGDSAPASGVPAAGAEASAATAPAGWQTPPEVVGPAPGIRFGSYGARFVAYLIDGLILGVVVTAAILVWAAAALFAAQAAIATAENVGDAVGAAFAGTFLAVFAIVLVVTLGYFPFFWARGGQTPGMKPFGLRVVRDKDGGPLGAGTAILRLLGLYVSGLVLYLGFIWVFIDKRRRGWHDLIAGTVVIEDARRS
jgi:uncharacterized RDD family membrane protein YckC